MHKNATKCNKTQSKWCINKHGASKIIDTFKTYQRVRGMQQWWRRKNNDLVNSKNPILPLIKLPVEVTWAEAWCKKQKRQPTNGKEKL
jgi:hypothetical protein